MTTYSLAPANYSDYRDFLKFRFAELKLESDKISINSFAKKSQISKSLLQFIFNKKRHVSLDRMPKLAKALKLTKDEEYFIYLLICKNSSKNVDISQHFESILSAIRNRYVMTQIAEPENSIEDRKKLYENDILMMLKSLIRLPDFREDVDWILENLKIPSLNKLKIEQALKELEDSGFAVRNSLGKLTVGDETLWRPDPYDPNRFSVYTKGAESMAALMQEPNIYKPSVYMSMSLTFDEVNLAKAEQVMIELHHKLLNLSKESKYPTALVQSANFLLTVCRLTNKIKSKDF
jgi:uncharacterized protein (TIGR02147 family)